MPGPAKSSRHLKILKGTLQPSRDAPEGAALSPVDSAPPRPAWLNNPDAVREFDRLAPLLLANKILTDGNVGVFVQMCALHGRLVAMWTEGTTPSAAMLSTYRALCNALGLLGMKLPAAGGKPNWFADHAKRLHRSRP